MALYPPKTDGRNQLAGIALCAGVGGLELGLHIAEPRYKTVCYVEREVFAASTLVARMADTALDDAPVWDDLTTFDGTAWRGKVHIVTAGYPCQPFSAAGRQRGTKDPRHLWPHVARIAQEADAEWLFCENVEGHLNLGLPEVLSKIRSMGFTAKAGLFSALEVGASHLRRRVFILAHADHKHLQQPRGHSTQQHGIALEAINRANRQADIDWRGGKGLVDDGGVGVERGRQADRCAALPLFAPAPFEFEDWQQVRDRRLDLQPELFGLGDGLANRVERPVVAGNGVVPLVAAYAWQTLRAAFD